MQVAAGTLHLNEVGDDLVQQTFALMRRADRKAAQRVAEAAARADDVIVFVQHRADVVEVSVAADALLLQQCVDLCKGAFVGGGNLRKDVFRHLR